MSSVPLRKISDAGDLAVHMGLRRDVYFNIGEYPHLDYGYAVNCHSIQGQTAERVLMHVDTSVLSG